MFVMLDIRDKVPLEALLKEALDRAMLGEEPKYLWSMILYAQENFLTLCMASFYPRRQVLNRMWVGSAADARDKAFLHSNNIGLVVNCSKTIPFVSEDILGHRVSVDDDSRYNDTMLRYLPSAVRAIDEALLSGKSVLVHCYAGIQRSCAVAAAYIMYKLGLTAHEAMDSVRRAKKEAFTPVPTFKHALELYYMNYISKSR